MFGLTAFATDPFTSIPEPASGIWVQIIDLQSANWALVNTGEYRATLQLVTNTGEYITTLSGLQIVTSAGWTPVTDTQTPNWVDVDTH